MLVNSLKSAAVGAAFFISCGSAQHSQYTRTLKFRDDGSFKIVTFSDIGMNDNSEDYLQTQSLLETVLSTESPDLVVLVGDIVDPAHADEYKFHWQSAME